MTETAELSASLEDYIEAIWNISARERVARATAIAEKLGVSKASVTGALRALAAKGLVNYDPYHFVTLTPEGEEAAERVVRRHRALARFLEDVLGLDATTAEEGACGLEHAMKPGMTARLVKFVEFIERCPLAGEKFREGFKRFFEGHDADADCFACVHDAVTSAESDRKSR